MKSLNSHKTVLFKEKEHRSSLRSAIERHLTKDHLVICDSLNYVKGFYEYNKKSLL